MSFAAVKVSASGERGEDCRSKVSRRAGRGRAAAAAAAVTMPRRKQTQPMQRKYSDDSKESDDRQSETDPDDLTEEQGLRTDFEGAREGGDCNDTFGGYQNLCFSADDPEAVDHLKGTDFYASNLEAPEKHLRVAADGEVRSGSEHRRSAVNSDGYLVPESHACSPPPRPVKRNEYPDGFRGDDHRRRLPETGRTEVEIERENFRRLNGGEEASAEMTERSLKRDYSSTNDVVQVKKERLSFGGVGRESGGDRSSSCPVLSSSGTFSGKEPSSSTSPTAASSSAAPGGRTAMMESAGLGFAVVLESDSGSSRLQSSVKQLESFVASVECHGGGGGARSAPTNPERKGVPGSAALSTPPRVPGVAVVAAAAAEQPRKSKGYSSRLKSHATALPKLAKQQQQQQQQQQHGGQTGFLDSARCFLAASQQSCGDPNQPLDLSVKTRPRDTAKYLSYSGSHDFFPSCSSSSSPSSSSAVGGGGGTSGSSLADLEKKFGNASAIFDRIGTKTWASPFCGALVSRLGMNLYNSKLPFGDPAAAVGPGAFGPLGMIPVPVQRFNSTAAAAATPVKSDVVPPTVKSGGRADDQEPPSGGPRSSTGGPPDPGFPWHAQHQKHSAPTAAAAADAPTDSHRKHTVFQCSCGAELDTLYHLTMHLQQTGHAPNRSKNVGRQEYSKLVRGQDMWLNHGCEQTRQILRCMECDESFKSLPELTVHMIKTKHYANIVGTDALQKKATVAPPSSSSLRAGETRSEPSTEEEEEEEEEEDDEEEEEEDEASSRVHCLVCLEAFDNPECLGAHIVEVGHYKDFTTAAGSERRGSTAESASSPVKDPLGDQSGGRGFPNSRAVGEPIPVGRSSPGAAKDPPAVDSLDRLPYPAAESNDRKRYCSVSESSAGDEVKEAETAAIIGERTPRRSDGDEIPTKYKRLGGETTERPSFVEAKSPSFVAKDRRRSSQREEDRSPSGETNLNASYFPQRRHRVFSGNKKDADNFSGRRREGEKEEDEEDGEEEEEVMEDRVESNADSSAFQADNFFRPSSSSSTNCSSDGYAIRAMETFIKKSFGSAETKHRLPATSLVGSPATQVGCYDPLGQPAAAAGQQELKATEALETTSRSLYQNKYLPPVYITTPPRDDRRPDREGVLPGVSPPFLPTARKIKMETGVERSPKGESSEKFGNDRESPNRESKAATTKEADRPGSTDRKAGKANRRSRQWSQRQGDTRQRRKSPEYGGKTDCDSVKSDSFLSNVNSNRTVDPHQQSVEMMKMELSDAESEEPLSSTSNNNNNNNNNNNLFRSSALESLQGLVYGKALNTEHPLDSLQKLIYGRGGSTPAGVAPRASGHLLNGANGSHAGAAVIMKDSDSLHHHHHPHHHLHHSLPPGTLILVNPIVTVVPGASGSTPSLNITLPGTGDPSAMARVVDDCSSGGGGGGGRASDLGGGAARRNRSPGAAAAEDNDDRENSLLRVYRCSGCRRRFSSKGSYRYHLSRCHVLTSSSSTTTAAAADKVPAAPSSIKDPLRKSPFVCMPLDVTAKFNKYYQLASELGTEAK